MDAILYIFRYLSFFGHLWIFTRRFKSEVQQGSIDGMAE